MTKSWCKLGLLYCPSAAQRHHKLLTHAANPVPVLIDGDIYRIFFSGRDQFNRSSVGAVDVDIVQRRIVREYNSPFFEHGSARSFYADGVSIGNCYEADGTTYLLFMGWQNPPQGHWRGDIGRLIVKPDLSLTLERESPLIGLSEHNPISVSYPWVMKNSGRYDMWYGSTVSWSTENGEMLHTIHHATSENGHTWKFHGVCVPFKVGDAQAFSRPTVVGNLSTGFEMWFSYRSGTGESYRIGYATSHDGSKWDLALEAAGINVSQAGWDSEMIEYPYVFDHNGERFMLYNGNSYGKTGFGLAILR